MKKIQCLIVAAFVVLVLCALGMTVSAATSDALDELNYQTTMKSVYGADFNPPVMPQNENDVDLFSGAYVANETDLVIPGRNGLDLRFVRRFNSNAAMGTPDYEMQYHHKIEIAMGYTYRYTTAEGRSGSIIVAFESEQAAMKEGVDDFYGVPPKEYTKTDEMGISYINHYTASRRKEGTHYIRDNSCKKIYLQKYSTDSSAYFLKDYAGETGIRLGNGWNIPVPAMITDYVVDYSNYSRYHGRFQTETGEVFECYFNRNTGSDPKWSNFNIKNPRYTLHVVDGTTFSIRKTHPSGFEYNLYAKGLDGKTYYFLTGNGMTMEFLALEDKYGNIVRYQDRTFTDSNGNQIALASDGITVNGVKMVQYEMQRLNGNQDPHQLFTIDDRFEFYVYKRENNSTEDILQSPNCTVYYFKQYVLSEAFYLVYDKIQNSNAAIELLPEVIEYPTGLIAEYTIAEKDNFHMTYKSYGKHYYIQERKEYDPSGQIKNERKFNYTFAEYNNSSYYSERYCKTGAFKDTVNLVQTKYTFDKYGRTLKVEKTGTNYRQMIENTYYGYNADSPITKQTITQYNGTTAIPMETSYTYDRYYNKLTEVSGDYSETNTYDTGSGAYNMLLTKTYKRDANTTIKLENTLTADRKSVATQKIYENNVLKSTTHFTYDSYGNIASQEVVTDSGNVKNTFAYAYPGDGVTQITAKTLNMKDADGNALPDLTTVVKTDRFGNVVYQKDANGNITTMAYDLLGRKTHQINPDGTTQTATYDTAANRITAIDERGLQMQYQYDAWGNLKYAEVFKNNAWTTLETHTYDALGRETKLIQIRDTANRFTQTTTYDIANRVSTVKITNKAGQTQRQISYGYAYSADAQSRPQLTVTATMAGDSSVTPATITRRTDYRGLLTYEAMQSGGTTLSHTYTYDYLGNRLTQKDARGYTTTFAYNYQNQPVKVTNALGNSSESAYDAAGRLVWQTDFMGNKTETTYDAAGRALKITAPFDGTHTAQTKQYYDANGNLITRKTLTNDIGGTERWDTVSFTYDNRNRNTTATAYPTADAPEITQQFYDNGGLLTARVTGLSAAIASPDNAPNGALRYTYDQMGHVLTETDEEERVESYTYDNFGNLLTKTDRNGTVLSYTYNADGKALSITTQSAADGIEPVTVNFTYNVLGAPVTAAANGQSTRYTYDGFGRVTAETTGDVVKNYTYDNNGNVTGVRITKNGTEIYKMSYTYDALGQLSKATAPDMTRTYTYNANGALASETDGTGTANYTYNAGGLLTGITSPAVTENYTYARNGMKTAETAYDGTQKSYVYDGAGRLVSETFDENSKTYSYDKRGNRVSGVELIEGATKTTTYAYDNSDRLTQAVTVHGQLEEETSYFYDNAGNLYSTMTGTIAPATSEKATLSLSATADGVSQYGWNALGQQVSYTGNGHTASYTYGADGLRTGKTVDGQTTQLVNVSGSVVAELGSQTTAYYRANGKVLYAKTGTTIRNYTYNGHGDVVRAGAQTYTYDAFGNQRNPSNNDTNPFRYCGEYWDGESGQVYLRARYYAPSLGRFTASDPARDGANWYVYCGGNPVMWVDPSGKLREGYTDENGVYHADPDAEEFGKDSDTYKILKDLGDRWVTVKQAGGDPTDYRTEADRVRRLAREGTPVQYAQDKIMNELHEGVKFAKGVFAAYWTYIDRLSILTNRFYTPQAVFGMVNSSADGWNYKWKDGWRVPYDKYNWNADGTDSDMNKYTMGFEGSYPKNWMPWMYFDGMFLSGADMGNLALGYIMCSMGFGEEDYHPWNDDPNGSDRFFQDYGAAMAKQGR